VIANETCASRTVSEEVRYRAGPGEAEVLVVAPALSGSRLNHWLASDSDRAREAAEQRLEASVAALVEVGLTARGLVGDADPLLALDDALRMMDPDEVIISTHTPERSNWLERKVVQQARERYSLPITHVVVDLQRERSQTDPAPRAAQPAEVVRLYHAAPYEEALAIRSGGYRDSHPPGHDGAGVLLTDRPPADAGATDEMVLFAVEVPREVASAHQVGEREGGRVFLLPAEALNRQGPAVEASDDWVE
jgi:GABA permease